MKEKRQRAGEKETSKDREPILLVIIHVFHTGEYSITAVIRAREQIRW